MGKDNAILLLPQLCQPIFFLAVPVACGNSKARVLTRATAVTQATAETMPGSEPAAPHGNSCAKQFKFFQNLNTAVKKRLSPFFFFFVPEDTSAFHPGLIVFSPKDRIVTRGLLFTLFSWISSFPRSHVVSVPFPGAQPIIIFSERLCGR